MENMGLQCCNGHDKVIGDLSQLYGTFDDILQQLKSVTVHSKTNLREASSLPGQRECYQLEGWEGEGGRHLVCNYC